MIKIKNHIYLIILLSILSSVAPMGVDTYLPAIPQIAQAFEVSIEKIELSLSIFLIGFSIGQIFGGPISDRYGRKISSVFGLLGFAFFSFLILLSSTIYQLWILRFLEAFFGGIVVVNAAASVRDRFHGAEAAKVFSLIGMVRSVAPLLAPAIGAFIIHFYSWEAIFVFLGFYALVVAFFVYKDLEESCVYSNQKVIDSFELVLGHKEALKSMITLGLSFGGFFIIIAKTSFIYIEHFEISTDYFPFFFGINFIILMVMIKMNVSLLQKFTPIFLVKMAIIIQVVVAIIFSLNYSNINLVFMMVLLATYMSMMAFIFGNCMALILEHFPKNAGVASGVSGVIQFGLGAIVSSLALSYHDGTFLPIGLALLVISSFAYLTIWKLKA